MLGKLLTKALFNHAQYQRDFTKLSDETFMRMSLDDIEWLDDNIEDDACRRILDEEMPRILDGYADVTFLAGGFPAFVLGRTNNFSDIDVFCSSPDIYDELRQFEASGVEETIPGRRTQFVLQKGILNVQIDLVNVVGGLEYFGIEIPEGGIRSVEDVLRTFDINWSLVGIDLNTRDIVFHESSSNPLPYFNERRIGLNSSKRLQKYADRLKYKSKDTDLITSLAIKYLESVEQKEQECRSRSKGGITASLGGGL